MGIFKILTSKWPWCNLDMTLVLCTSKAQLLRVLLCAHKLPRNSAVGIQVCPGAQRYLLELLKFSVDMREGADLIIFIQYLITFHIFLNSGFRLIKLTSVMIRLWFSNVIYNFISCLLIFRMQYFIANLFSFFTLIITFIQFIWVRSPGNVQMAF